MSRNEIDETFEKYGIYTGAGLTIFDKGEEISKFVDFFKRGKPVPFEHPDGYIKDDNRVLIIEHFAIDGYDEFPNGGSELLRNESRQTKAFSKIPVTEAGVYLSEQLGTSNSYGGFIENCKRRFEQHYSQIEAYKEHLRNEKIADNSTEFTVCFLMDEVSPLGTLTHDGEKTCPVCLAKSKEFLDFYSNHPNVDWIISSVVLPEGYKPYFFAHKEIDTYNAQTRDYASYKFLSSNPVRTDFKVLISKEKPDGVS